MILIEIGPNLLRATGVMAVIAIFLIVVYEATSIYIIKRREK